MRKDFCLRMFFCLCILSGFYIKPVLAETAKTDEPPAVVVKEHESRIDDLEEKIEELTKDGAINEKIVEKRSLTRNIFMACLLIIIGIAFFILLKYGLKKFEEAIVEFEKLFPSHVNDGDPGSHIMETNRNYRHQAALEISRIYEEMGRYDKALDYVLNNNF